MTGPRPTLTAIILNHDYGRFVGAAIGSVLAQTDPFDEVVVVDDGSTDDSLAVIAGFRPRVKLIAQANAGQMRASIAGLAAATGDHVYILDADDLARPDLVATIRPHLAGRPVKLQFPVAAVAEDGTPLASVFPQFPAGYGSAEMLRDNRVLGFHIAPPTAGNVYRRDFLLGLDLASLGANDPLDGVPSMIAPGFGPVVTLDAPLACYRVHGGGHSQWSRPSVAVLEREVAWLGERWQAAARLAPATPAPDDLETTLYVAERRMMIAVLAGRPAGAAARRYLSRLAASPMPGLTRAGLGAWGAAMLLPVPALRRRLVLARRSPAARPRLVNAAILGAKRLAAAPRRLLARARA